MGTLEAEDGPYPWHRPSGRRRQAPETAYRRPAAADPILRDADGYYSFAHPSFVDFHVAQRIFGGIAVGDGKLFASAQTSHDTDMVIREFVACDQGSTTTVQRWMSRAPSPVLRVDSAGVLAKVGGGMEDAVIRSLKRDGDTWHLYRVSWPAACRSFHGQPLPM